MNFRLEPVKHTINILFFAEKKKKSNFLDIGKGGGGGGFLLMILQVFGISILLSLPGFEESKNT